MRADLSRRLYEVASRVPQGAHVVDVGSDHGYLVCALASHKRTTKCIAIECNHKPLACTERSIRTAGVQHLVEARFADGLAGVSDGEVDTVCISGMGSRTIQGIFERGLRPLASVQTIILQCNDHPAELRQWLYTHGWTLRDEHVFTARGHTYTTLHLVRGEHDPSYEPPYPNGLNKEDMFWIGPLLAKSKAHPDYTIWWNRELHRLQGIVRSLESAQRSKPTDIVRAKHRAACEELRRAQAICTHLGA